MYTSQQIEYTCYFRFRFRFTIIKTDYVSALIREQRLKTKNQKQSSSPRVRSPRLFIPIIDPHTPFHCSIRSTNKSMFLWSGAAVVDSSIPRPLPNWRVRIKNHSVGYHVACSVDVCGVRRPSLTLCSVLCVRAWILSCFVLRSSASRSFRVVFEPDSITTKGRKKTKTKQNSYHSKRICIE